MKWIFIDQFPCWMNSFHSKNLHQIQLNDMSDYFPDIFHAGPILFASIECSMICEVDEVKTKSVVVEAVSKNVKSTSCLLRNGQFVSALNFASQVCSIRVKDTHVKSNSLLEKKYWKYYPMSVINYYQDVPESRYLLMCSRRLWKSFSFQKFLVKVDGDRFRNAD